MCQEQEWPSLLGIICKLAGSNTAPHEASHLKEGTSFPAHPYPEPFLHSPAPPLLIGIDCTKHRAPFCHQLARLPSSLRPRGPFVTIALRHSLLPLTLSFSGDYSPVSEGRMFFTHCRSVIRGLQPRDWPGLE